MARETTAVGGPQTVALPLHLQKLESLLNLAPLLGHIESLFKGNGSNWHRRQEWAGERGWGGRGEREGGGEGRVLPLKSMHIEGECITMW